MGKDIDFKAISLVDSIIDNLDNEALLQLTSGNEKDLNNLYDEMFIESAKVIRGYKKIVKTDVKFHNLTALSENIEEAFRIESFNYFVGSVLPGFDQAWHHIEWGQFLQIYQYLCIIAARDHCFGEDTKVRMFDGSVKNIQDIEVGDKVMGPDSKYRTVLSIHSGTDKKMYRVNQTRGESYTVNSNHTLSLYKRKRAVWSRKLKKAGKINLPKLEDINIEEYNSRSKYSKLKHAGYKVCVDFPEKEVSIDPYYLGLWLGDGTAYYPNQITTADKEIVNYLEEVATKHNLRLVKRGKYCYSISMNMGENGHPIISAFKDYDLRHNKHIPNDYIYNSREIRLQLLAGFIDADGCNRDNVLYINQSRKHLIIQLKELCHTLGFRCVQSSRVAKCNGKEFPSYQLTISGEMGAVIPVKLPRKKIVFNDKSNSMGRRPKYFKGDNNYDIVNVSNLKIEDIGQGRYFGFECDGDHRFLLEDSTVVHNSKSFTLSLAYPLWKMYRYMKGDQYNNTRKDLAICKEGMLITNEYKLGKKLLAKIREEVEVNPILSKKLLPRKRDGWAKEQLNCANGAQLALGSYGTSMRGPHPGWIIVDDFLDKSCLYSQEQREKFIDVFHSEIMNMIIPGGSVTVVGTPFHDEDLYGDLKKKDKWKVFEYPAIFPDGSLLWEDRYGLEELLDKRNSQGAIRFSREILVKPVTSESTIFPYEMVGKCFTETFSIINNYYSTPKKFERIVLGADFARSANVGADYSVFTTLGIDDHDQYWVLNIYRAKGKTLNEQMAILKGLYADFNHDIMVFEANVMQQLFVDAAVSANLPIQGHTTGTNKYDLDKGLPSLAILFELERIRLPRGDQRSIDITDTLAMELASMTWTSKGKLEGAGAHDDMVMSLLMAVIAAREGTGFDFSFI